MVKYKSYSDSAVYVHLRIIEVLDNNRLFGKMKTNRYFRFNVRIRYFMNIQLFQLNREYHRQQYIWTICVNVCDVYNVYHV